MRRYSESAKWALCYEASKGAGKAHPSETLNEAQRRFNDVSARFCGDGEDKVSGADLLDAAIRFVALRDFNVTDPRDARILVMLAWGEA